MRDEIVRVLRENGLSDEPEKYDSSIHSWRCEHPDIYGRCDCFEELVDELLAVIEPPRSPFSSCCIKVGTDECKCSNPTPRLDLSQLGHGRCPKCQEFKFVGHGPLCAECFHDARPESIATSEEP